MLGNTNEIKKASASVNARIERIFIFSHAPQACETW